MFIIISPAKTIDFETKIGYAKYTLPEHLGKSEHLVQQLRKMSPQELSGLMNISTKLAVLNYNRYKEWHLPFNDQNARQAIFVFKGEVFRGIDIERFSDEELEYTQNHLRILSGLHGTLRPLDLIQPYRLEMGIKLTGKEYKNLYEFWSNEITYSVQAALDQQGDNLLINLASDEYFKSINTKQLNARIITPIFKEYKNGTYKFLSVYGKKARGMMTRFILQNKLRKADNLKLFEEEGYYYNENLSSEDQPVFTRG
jgi:cytoplasmic iron level regulating protein YaaA (DUF328/UPF0246 family)